MCVSSLVLFFMMGSAFLQAKNISISTKKEFYQNTIYGIIKCMTSSVSDIKCQLLDQAHLQTETLQRKHKKGW